jgi:hypothetical protein
LIVLQESGESNVLPLERTKKRRVKECREKRIDNMGKRAIMRSLFDERGFVSAVIERSTHNVRGLRKLTISGSLDRLWQFSDRDLEPRLNGGENTLVLIVGDESDSETLGSETTSTSTGATAKS